MQRRWLARPISLVLAIALLLHAQGGVAFATCPQVQCLYLPLAARYEPVRVNSVGYGIAGRSINLKILGDVLNTSRVPLYNVQVKAILHDQSGMTTTGECINSKG